MQFLKARRIKRPNPPIFNKGMLRAGSIFYTIVITLIIAIITSSLILYNYQVGFYYQKLEQQKR